MKVAFFGIGSQKAATSWLYTCLTDHPETNMPIKEIHFFSKEENWCKGIKWYEKIFKNKKGEMLSGEFSTSYLYSKVCADRIYNYNPDAKIIVSIRDPYERTISHFNHCKANGQIRQEISLSEAIKIRPDLIENSLISKMLKYYINLFGNSKVHIINYKDILNNPNEVLKKTAIFLNINSNFVSFSSNKKVNKTFIIKNLYIDKLLSKIARLFEEIGFSNLLLIFRKVGLTEIIRSLNRSKTKKKVILKYNEKKLLDKFFIKENLKLYEILKNYK